MGYARNIKVLVFFNKKDISEEQYRISKMLVR